MYDDQIPIIPQALVFTAINQLKVSNVSKLKGTWFDIKHNSTTYEHRNHKKNGK